MVKWVHLFLPRDQVQGTIHQFILHFMIYMIGDYKIIQQFSPFHQRTMTYYIILSFLTISYTSNVVSQIIHNIFFKLTYIFTISSILRRPYHCFTETVVASTPYSIHPQSSPTTSIRHGHFLFNNLKNHKLNSKLWHQLPFMKNMY